MAPSRQDDEPLAEVAPSSPQARERSVEAHAKFLIELAHWHQSAPSFVLDNERAAAHIAAGWRITGRADQTNLSHTSLFFF